MILTKDQDLLLPPYHSKTPGRLTEMSTTQHSKSVDASGMACWHSRADESSVLSDWSPLFFTDFKNHDWLISGSFCERRANERGGIFNTTIFFRLRVYAFGKKKKNWPPPLYVGFIKPVCCWWLISRDLAKVARTMLGAGGGKFSCRSHVFCCITNLLQCS